MALADATVRRACAGARRRRVRHPARRRGPIRESTCHRRPPAGAGPHRIHGHGPRLYARRFAESHRLAAQRAPRHADDPRKRTRHARYADHRPRYNRGSGRRRSGIRRACHPRATVAAVHAGHGPPRRDRRHPCGERPHLRLAIAGRRHTRRAAPSPTGRRSDAIRRQSAAIRPRWQRRSIHHAAHGRNRRRGGRRTGARAGHHRRHHQPAARTAGAGHPHRGRGSADPTRATLA